MRSHTWPEWLSAQTSYYRIQCYLRITKHLDLRLRQGGRRNLNHWYEWYRLVRKSRRRAFNGPSGKRATATDFDRIFHVQRTFNLYAHRGRVRRLRHRAQTSPRLLAPRRPTLHLLPESSVPIQHPITGSVGITPLARVTEHLLRRDRPVRPARRPERRGSRQLRIFASGDYLCNCRWICARFSCCLSWASSI